MPAYGRWDLIRRLKVNCRPFIHGSLDAAFRISGYVASNGWFVYKMYCKGLGKEGVFKILTFLSGNYLECLHENMNILIEDSGCPGEIQTSYLPNTHQ